MNYKFSRITKNHHDWNQHYSFIIEYKQKRISYFTKKSYFAHRHYKFFIPTFIDTAIRLLFKKTTYTVKRKEHGHGYETEHTNKKTAKRYVKEFKNDGFTDIEMIRHLG